MFHNFYSPPSTLLLSLQWYLTSMIAFGCCSVCLKKTNKNQPTPCFACSLRATELYIKTYFLNTSCIFLPFHLMSAIPKTSTLVYSMNEESCEWCFVTKATNVSSHRSGFLYFSELHYIFSNGTQFSHHRSNGVRALSMALSTGKHTPVC